MKPIHIRAIPHQDHRKEAGDTVGDWYTKFGSNVIEVSEMSDWRYEILVSIHELVEKVLCDHAGITEKQVDEFDFNWKEHDNIEEAGNDSRAPYHKQHKIANVIERLLAIELEVNWNEYEKEIMSL